MIINNKISIIIPTLNGWPDTSECILSIYASKYPKKLLEIIVVDNHSSDNTPKYVNEVFPQVKVIKLSHNTGYAKAANTGFLISNGDYILFGNNDVVYDKNFFREMVKLAKSDKRIGVVGGKAYIKGQQNKIAIKGLKTNAYLGFYQYDLKDLDKIRECDLLPGGGFFVKRNVLEKVGLLDEDYFLYYEDLDFYMRAKRKNFKIIYNPNAVFYHAFGKTTGRENASKIIYYGYRSKIRCILKNSTLPQIITSLFLQLFILIHLDNIRSSIKTYKPFVKAIHWNLKHLKETFKLRKISSNAI
jgi:GT2 family glycosyltransferase